MIVVSFLARNCTATQERTKYSSKHKAMILIT